MVSYVSILLVAVLIVVALSSRLIADYLERRTMEMNARLLSTFTRTVDTLILGGIDDLATKIAQERGTNRDIARYFDGPLAGHLVDVREVDRQLEMLRYASPAVYSIGIYYARNELLVSTESIRHSLFQPASAQPDLAYFRSLVEEAAGIPWGTPLWRFDPQYGSRILSSTLRPVPQAAVHLVRLIRDGGAGESLGAVIVTIREDLLSRILQQAAPDDLNHVMIVDGNGTVVSHADKALLGKPFDGLAFAEPIDPAAVGKSFMTRFDGKPCVVSTSRSGATGWTLVSMTPSDRIADVSAFVWKRGILIAAFAVLVGALISFLTAKRLTSPLERLVRLCQGIVQGRVPQSRNEIAYLQSAIADLTETRDGHERKFRENLPALRATFALDLLSRDIPEEALARARMDLVELHFDAPAYTVFLAVPAEDRQGDGRLDLKKTELAKLDLRHAAETAFAAVGARCLSCERDGCLAFIVNFGGDRSALVGSFRGLFSPADSSPAWRGAVGGTAASPCGVPRCYDEAVAALRVRYFMPDGIFFAASEAGEGAAGDESQGAVPQRGPASLIAFKKAIRAADGKAALPALHGFIADLTGMPYGYARSVELLSESVSVVEDLLFSLNIRFTDLDPQARGLDLRGRAGRCGDVRAFGAWFEGVVTGIFEVQGRSGAARGADLARRARDFVERNVGNRQLSLDYVADALSVSPSHLSRLFKQSTGLNFVDLVGDRKLERAQELIATTKLKVEDVADAVGYATPQYLIAKFKKRFGCTPMEYRRGQTPAFGTADGGRRDRPNAS